MGVPQCLSREGAALPHSARLRHPGSARGHRARPCPGPSSACTRPWAAARGNPGVWGRCQTPSRGLQRHQGPRGSLPHPLGHPDLPLVRQRHRPMLPRAMGPCEGEDGNPSAAAGEPRPAAALTAPPGRAAGAPHRDPGQPECGMASLRGNSFPRARTPPGRAASPVSRTGRGSSCEIHTQIRNRLPCPVLPTQLI